MPTMMSARSSRSISARISGVSTLTGTGPPYHRGRLVGPVVPSPASAFRDPGDRPVAARDARGVAAVRRLERHLDEPDRAPLAVPRGRRRPNVRRAPNVLGLAEGGLQEPLALEQRDVEQELAV